jgi:glyoxylase-like metal-dependent hydrolase (beta-lactamase superfamily II)
VDTGLGRDDMAQGARRLGRMFHTLLRPVHDTGATAIEQVRRLGFSPRDVRHIVLTHLDLDHAGGLADFPEAAVHVLDDEYLAAMEPATRHERLRYRPAQLAHGPRWHRYQAEGAPWYGFSCVRELDGLPPEVLLVPLPGHSRGHGGVAIRSGDRWLLHCGDAYFHVREMSVDAPWCPPALRLFQRMVAVRRDAMLANQDRLRVLVRDHGDELSVFCAHDPVELDRALAAALKRPGAASG